MNKLMIGYFIYPFTAFALPITIQCQYVVLIEYTMSFLNESTFPCEQLQRNISDHGHSLSNMIFNNNKARFIKFTIGNIN